MIQEKIQKEKINDYVDKLLKTDANSKYLPDFVAQMHDKNTGVECHIC